MKRVIVAIRDVKLESFLNPWTCETKAVALRAFSDAVGDAKTPISQHPEDYDLYQIAEIDVSTGIVVPTSPILHLAPATEFVGHA